MINAANFYQCSPEEQSAFLAANPPPKVVRAARAHVGNKPIRLASRQHGRIKLDCINLDDVLHYLDPERPARVFRECLAGHGFLCGCDPSKRCPPNCGDYQREAQ